MPYVYISNDPLVPHSVYLKYSIQTEEPTVSTKEFQWVIKKLTLASMTCEGIILEFYVINVQVSPWYNFRKMMNHIRGAYIWGHSFLQENVDKRIYFILKQFKYVGGDGETI